jgi:peroxiredoxin
MAASASRVPVVGMQHEAALALDRSAHQDRATDGLIGRRRVQLVQNRLQIHARRRSIQPQAHGVIRPVGADQDDSVFEPGVVDPGHGDQQSAGQGGGFAHDPGIIRPESGASKPNRCLRCRPWCLCVANGRSNAPASNLSETDMTIQIGDRIPAATLAQATAEGPKPVSTDDIFAGKTVALFAVPGAFTPTCSARHLPGFKDHLADIQAKGVDTVACISVNDAFVMKAWGESQGITDDSIVMLADGNGELTRALGLVLDGTGFGLGERSQRYSMLVKDGVVEQLNIEQGGEFKVSSAEHLLAQL